MFTIAHTGVTNRSRPQDADPDWLFKRTAQCNFDTILQVISLRSQPEIIKYPTLIDEKVSCFGDEYTHEFRHCAFDFEVQHPSVFQDASAELGSLYSDCSGVPMILTLDQHLYMPNFLDTSANLKNIHFEVL